MKVMVAVLVALTCVVVVVSFAAPPTGIYQGGEDDGFDANVSTNSVIPPLPPSGTVIMIK